MSYDNLNPNIQKSLADDLVKLASVPTIIGGIANRYVSNYINPETGNVTYLGKTSTIMRFKFPSNCIDFSNSTLQFQITQAGTPGTYSRMSQNISCIIYKMRILFGSQEIFLTENFNLLHSYLTLYNQTSWFTGLGQLYQGMGNSTYRNSETNSGNTYMLHFGPFVELLDRVLPLNLVNEQFIVELTLANPETCMETDYTNFSYSLTNVEWHYDTIQLEDNYNNLLKEKILSTEGLCIPFRNFQNYIDTSVTSGVLKPQIQLPYRYLALQGVISLLRNAANVASATVNDKFASYLGFSNFVNSVIRINNVLLPADRVNNTNEVLELNLQLFKKHYDDDVYIASNWPQYFSMDFPLGQDLKGYDDEQLQGISAATSGFSIIHQFQLSSNAVNLENQYFGINGACLRILPNGGVKFVQ